MTCIETSETRDHLLHFRNSNIEANHNTANIILKLKLN